MNAEEFVEVYIVQEMNIYKAQELKKTLQSYLINNKSLILDLSNVNEIDSSGLQLLMALKKSLNIKNKELFIRNPSEPVKNLLSVIKMEKYFNLVE